MCLTSDPNEVEIAMIEVIILAQGTQSRLGMRHGYKQLLPLPSCGGVPILARTLAQLGKIVPASNVTVVTWRDIAARLPADCRCVELEDPGNSALRGIDRYLRSGQRMIAAADYTMVLLGDVVYSWRCLGTLAHLGTTSGFVGTADLAADRGELWGIAWCRQAEIQMRSSLSDGLLRHPPFEEYQPGQLRRWIAGFERGDLRDHVERLRRRGRYVDVDDYTRDIDLPAHIALLPQLSELARVDDLAHDLQAIPGDPGPSASKP